MHCHFSGTNRKTFLACIYLCTKFFKICVHALETQPDDQFKTEGHDENHSQFMLILLLFLLFPIQVI